MNMRKVPLSPTYVKFYAEKVISSPEFVLQTKLRYAASKIPLHIKNSRAIQRDISGSYWHVVDGASVIDVDMKDVRGLDDSALPFAPKIVAEKIRQAAKITEDESLALVAFNSDQILEGDVKDIHSGQQGGLWQLPQGAMTAFFYVLNISFGIIERSLGLKKSFKKQEQKEEYDVEVDNAGQTTKILDGLKGRQCEGSLFKFDYHFKMINGDGFFEASLDMEQYNCSVNEALFKDVILVNAKAKLAERDSFNDQDYKATLFALVPCLVDDDFAREFIREFYIHANDEMRAFADEAIKACHDNVTCEKISKLIPVIVNNANEKAQIGKDWNKHEVKKDSGKLFSYGISIGLGVVLFSALAGPIPALIALGCVMIVAAGYAIGVAVKLRTIDNAVPTIVIGDTSRIWTALGNSTQPSNAVSLERKASDGSLSASDSEPGVKLENVNADSGQNQPPVVREVGMRCSV